MFDKSDRWWMKRLERFAWESMSDEEREVAAQEHIAKHDKLIADLNALFAVIIDGPLAGEIVSLSNGMPVKERRLNNLIHADGFPNAAKLWLRDPRRRGISNDELARIRSGGKI